MMSTSILLARSKRWCLDLFLAVFIVFLGELWFGCNTASANVVSGISGETEENITRISFDTKTTAKYSTGISRDGRHFYLYIHDIDNPQLKFGKAEIRSASVISGVHRGVRGKSDIVYIFDLKKKIKPHVFNSRVGKGYRLVIEFPHGELTSSKTTNIDDGIKNEQPKDTVNSSDEKRATKSNEDEVKNITNTKELEEALFSDLNGSGDGVSNVRPDASTQVVPSVPVAEKQVRKIEKPYIVVVDPGHGGKDPGAIGINGVYEKTVTLSIGKMLVEYINSDPKMRGYLTRSSDKFIELGERSEIARRRKANILISIHADSAASKQATGASVLVLSNNRASRENSKIEKNKERHKDLLGGAGEIISNDTSDNPYFAAMILDLTSDNARTEGFNLATDILGSLRKSVSLHHSTPIHRSLAVLKAPDIPSLLIETGYLSNVEEAKLLSTISYRRVVAYSIYLGIKKYVGKNPMIIHDNSQVATSNSSKTAVIKGGSDSSGGAIYTVSRGDNLTVIAQKFGVSIKELKKLNNMKSNTVMLGQKLKIPRKK